MDVAPERREFSETRKKWEAMGIVSFDYFSLDKQRKVIRQQAKEIPKFILNNMNLFFFTIV